MKNHNYLSESLYFHNHEFEKDLATFFTNNPQTEVDRGYGCFEKV